MMVTVRPIPYSPALSARFLSHTRQEGECWVWTGSTSPKGYGQTRVGRATLSAHRLSHIMFKGPIPDGLEVDHLCHNRACVNPAHLEAVTHAENLRRAQTQVWQINAAKTHCPQGHPYAGDNLVVVPRERGWSDRRCRTCIRARSRAWMNANRAKARAK